MGRGSFGVGGRRRWRRWRWGDLGVGVGMRDRGPEGGPGRGGLCRLRLGEFNGLMYLLLYMYRIFGISLIFTRAIRVTFQLFRMCSDSQSVSMKPLGQWLLGLLLNTINFQPRKPQERIIAREPQFL